MWHVWGKGEAYAEFWWGYLMERDKLEDLDVDGKIILKLMFKKWDRGAWIGWSGSG
jgi:hypothetical protein